MSFFDRRRIRAADGGRFELHLPEGEQQVLRDLVGQLRELLALGPTEPSLRRLFPTAYPDDEAREREYRELVGDELLRQHLGALDVVADTVSATELDEEQLTGWLQGLNQLRLVLGTRIDATEDPPELEEDDPLLPAWALYEYLGLLLDECVRALEERL